MNIFSIRDSKRQGIMVVVAVLTLVLVGYFAFTRLENSIRKREQNRKQALRVAEYGLQEVFQELNQDRGHPSKKTVSRGFEQGDCQIHLIPRDSGSVEITAVGDVEGAKREIWCVAQRPAGAISYSINKWEER